MNFYKHHIGDYAKSTAHLSMIEHGAYLLMLQHHYATEAPLPYDIMTIARIVRATSKAEMAAISVILEQFWILTDAGWVQERAQQEIERASAQRDTNRELGKRGGRPKKTETQTKPITEQITESVFKTEPNTKPNRNPSQTPDSRQEQKAGFSHTEPRTPSSVGTSKAQSSPPDPKPTLAGIACRAIREAGIADTNPSHPKLLALLEAGSTPDEFADAARECVAKDKRNFAYVLGTMTRRREEAAKPKPAMHQGAMATAPPTAAAKRDAERSKTFESLTGMGAKNNEPVDITGIAERVD